MFKTKKNKIKKKSVYFSFNGNHFACTLFGEDTKFDHSTKDFGVYYLNAHFHIKPITHSNNFFKHVFSYVNKHKFYTVEFSQNTEELVSYAHNNDHLCLTGELSVSSDNLVF